jgi:hypothetical protein
VPDGGAGNFWYITDINVTSADGGLILLTDGLGTACSDGGLFAQYFIGAGGNVVNDLVNPIKVPNPVPICCSSTNSFYTCTIEGFQQP